jgi:hypothetical protein
VVVVVQEIAKLLVLPKMEALVVVVALVFLQALPQHLEAQELLVKDLMAVVLLVVWLLHLLGQVVVVLLLMEQMVETT